MPAKRRRTPIVSLYYIIVYIKIQKKICPLPPFSFWKKRSAFHPPLCLFCNAMPFRIGYTCYGKQYCSLVHADSTRDFNVFGLIRFAQTNIKNLYSILMGRQNRQILVLFNNYLCAPWNSTYKYISPFHHFSLSILSAIGVTYSYSSGPIVSHQVVSGGHYVVSGSSSHVVSGGSTVHKVIGGGSVHHQVVHKPHVVHRPAPRPVLKPAPRPVAHGGIYLIPFLKGNKILGFFNFWTSLIFGLL